MFFVGLNMGQIKSIADGTHSSFSLALVAWQRQHGRHHLPWQGSDAYRVWLSEIMLQQTQVRTVLAYYPRFVAAFPTVADLAAADEDAVLRLWQGLGYYRRARMLHQAAQQVMTHHQGRLPDSRRALQTLSGVGRSTAAAIAAFAFGQREAILDGNVKRVLCRVFALDGEPNNKAFEDTLWTLAESLLPDKRSDMAAYTQGLMDLGATVCKRSQPACAVCPLKTQCQAYQHQRVAELPRKKTPAPVALWPMYWLVLCRADGAVWLQKRPTKGIWGGLWCVPCMDDLAEVEHSLAAVGLCHDDWEIATEISHRLTHRLLQITPLLIRTAMDTSLPTLPSLYGQWVLPSQWPDYALPKPLAVYLQQHAD